MTPVNDHPFGSINRASTEMPGVWCLNNGKVAPLSSGGNTDILKECVPPMIWCRDCGEFVPFAVTVWSEDARKAMALVRAKQLGRVVMGLHPEDDWPEVSS